HALPSWAAGAARATGATSPSILAAISPTLVSGSFRGSRSGSTGPPISVLSLPAAAPPLRSPSSAAGSTSSIHVPTIGSGPRSPPEAPPPWGFSHLPARPRRPSPGRPPRGHGLAARQPRPARGPHGLQPGPGQRRPGPPRGGWLGRRRGGVVGAGQEGGTDEV